MRGLRWPQDFYFYVIGTHKDSPGAAVKMKKLYMKRTVRINESLVIMQLESSGFFLRLAFLDPFCLDVALDASAVGSMEIHLMLPTPTPTYSAPAAPDVK